MRLILLIVLFLTVFAHTLDYCEVEDQDVNLYTFSDEVQKLPLYKYIRGFDLDFSTSDAQLSWIFKPYQETDAGKVELGPGYVIVDIDGRDDQNLQWAKEGVVLAQRGEK